MNTGGQIATGTSAKLCRVLVVEDEFVARHALLRLLQISGFNAHAASSGEEALGLLNQENRIDAILVDLDLPGMDGLSFIHAVSEKNDRILAVLITAHSVDEVSPGRPIHHFRKPVDFEQLVTLLKKNRLLATSLPENGRSSFH